MHIQKPKACSKLWTLLKSFDTEIKKCSRIARIESKHAELD